jgi:hypothetical protein
LVGVLVFLFGFPAHGCLPITGGKCCTRPTYTGQPRSAGGRLFASIGVCRYDS